MPDPTYPLKYWIDGAEALLGVSSPAAAGALYGQVGELSLAQVQALVAEYMGDEVSGGDGDVPVRGPAVAAFEYVGPWDEDVAYERFESVSHEGASFVARRPNVGVEPLSPGDEDWGLLSEAGGVRVADANTWAATQTLSTVGSSTGAPRGLMFAPAAAGETWRVGSAAGAGLQGGGSHRSHLYSAKPLRMSGMRGTSVPPAFESAGGSDPAIWIDNTQPGIVGVRYRAAVAQSVDQVRIEDSTGARRVAIDENFHVGIDQPNPDGALLQIGQDATGAMTQKAGTGARVKLATTPTLAFDGIQVNLSVVEDSPLTTMEGMVSIVEAHDTIANPSGADLVGKWGEARAYTASNRNLFGANFMARAMTGSAFAAALIGAEIAAHNDSVIDNSGGAAHLVSRGMSATQYAMWIGEGPASATQTRFRHGIVIPSGVGSQVIGTHAPLSTVFHYGPVMSAAPGEGGPGPDASLAPFFQVNRAGDVRLAGVPTNKIGAFGIAGAVQQTLPVAATDLPSAMALVNALRSGELAYGFFRAA